MKKTSRSAFLCKVAAWLSKMFAIWNQISQTSSYHTGKSDLFKKLTSSLCIAFYPLTGELAEDGGDVARVLSHDFADIFLNSRWDTASHAGHDLLKFQKRQWGVP